MRLFIALALLSFSGYTVAQSCPDVGIGNNPTAFQRSLALQIFDTVPASDPLTIQALDFLRAMMDSPDQYQRDLSYTVALYLSVFKDNLGFGSPVTFCALAEGIEAFLSGDNVQLVAALEGLMEFESILSAYRQQNSIISSGCSAPSVITGIVFPSCVGNGFVYDVAGILAARGSVFPAGFSAIIPTLYASTNIIDQLIALFSTSFSTPQMQTLFERYPLPLSLRATALESTSSSLACCPQRLNLLDNLSKNTSKAAANILQSLITASG